MPGTLCEILDKIKLGGATFYEKSKIEFAGICTRIDSCFFMKLICRDPLKKCWRMYDLLKFPGLII